MNQPTQIPPRRDTLFLTIIGILSVAVPVLVALLLFIPQTGKLGDLDVSFLPHLNAVLNTATSVALVVGWLLVRNQNLPYEKRTRYHRTAMMTAFVLSVGFLLAYVTYHFQAPPTRFGDVDHSGVVTEAEKLAVGSLRYVYLFLLLTHIVLAAVVVPFVLLALYFAFTGQYAKHTRTTRYTLPIWLYVSVTGVIVYLMISPYYA